jgi:hypothetical protein
LIAFHKDDYNCGTKGNAKNQRWKNQRQEIESPFEVEVKESIISVDLVSIECLDNDVENNVDFYVDHYVNKSRQLDNDNSHASKRLFREVVLY